MRQTANDFYFEQGSGLGDIGDMGIGPCDPGFVGPLSPDEAAVCASASTPSYTTITTPQGDYQVVNGQIFDPNGKIVSSIPTGTVIGSTGIGLNPTTALWVLGGIALILFMTQSGGRRR